MTAHPPGSEDIVSSYRGLRRSVGAIGLLLPFWLIVAGLGWLGGIRPSISAYYYAPFSGGVFVGALSAIGVFLISYRGYVPEAGERLSDRHLALAAGTAAILVALFPTDGFVGQTALVAPVSVLHFIAAAVFLSLLGVFSLYRFTRSDLPPDQQPPDKRLRNRIYRKCGRVIFACLGLIALFKLLEWRGLYSPPLSSWMFWLESIAVWAFGISWLVKGEVLEAIGPRLRG